MPITLNDLPAQDEADVSDDDLLLIWETSAGSNNSKKVTRAHLLKDVAREGGDHDFGTSEVDHLTAGVDALTFGSTAALTNLLKAEGSITVTALAAGASETHTITMTGVQTTDYLLGVTFTAQMEDGLTFAAWISAADTVSVRVRNNKGGSASGGSFTVRAVAMRFA